MKEVYWRLEPSSSIKVYKNRQKSCFKMLIIHKGIEINMKTYKNCKLYFYIHKTLKYVLENFFTC